MIALFIAALISVAIVVFSYFTITSPWMLIFVGFVCGWSVALAYTVVSIERAGL
jgi:1,4-dihydroxy-2-naphthoate octaprenyltransferase